MTNPTFIFSLDCEGYWGMADAVADGWSPGWTSAALVDTYQRLLALFDRFEVPATWAFVAAFVHTPEEMHERGDLTEQPLSYRGRDWTAAFKRAWAAGDTDGWLCPEALGAVRRAGGHEVAAHGYSHLPLAEVDTDAAVARRELDLQAAFWATRGIRPDTVVFPRNQPGHLTMLGEHFVAYRPPHPLEVRRDAAARLLRLVDEVNPFCQPAAQSIAGPLPIPLPPAMLLNHRAGGRRLVPPAITLLRIRRLLQRAMDSGRVVHLYSHPHNFLTGQGQFELLEGVLSLVRTHSSAGELAVMTQSGYAASVRAPN